MAVPYLPSVAASSTGSESTFYAGSLGVGITQLINRTAVHKENHHAKCNATASGGSLPK
jgi:hypothetical protein